jgi:hypothetical protein
VLTVTNELVVPPLVTALVPPEVDTAVDTADDDELDVFEEELVEAEEQLPSAFWQGPSDVPSAEQICTPGIPARHAQATWEPGTQTCAPEVELGPEGPAPLPPLPSSSSSSAGLLLQATARNVTEAKIPRTEIVRRMRPSPWDKDIRHQP